MGLFINSEKHENIYKNEAEINEPNQSYFKRDHFEELVNGQLRVNQSLQHSIHGLKSLYEQQENVQTNKWKEISNRLNELKVSNVQQDKDQQYVVERLRNLESDNKKLQITLDNNQLSDQELLSQVSSLSQSNQEVVNQLEVYCMENQEFKLKADEQYELQKQMSEQLSKQEDMQEEVSARVENQEALTEKITRQIEYFRTILFERTNYLAEKIEDGYQHTSSYLANLITSPDQKPTKIVTEQKKEEDHHII